MKLKIIPCDLNSGNVIRDAFPWLWPIRYYYSSSFARAITKEALRILGGTMLENMTEIYENERPINLGDKLKIRTPNKYTVRRIS